jgi:UDP-N-acetylglucosamine diphosphorylase/glucosamine-1-phosphate N-acetyltransferase
MNIILFDLPEIRLNLLPFTYIRPVAELRVGILTLAEKWKKISGYPVSFLTEKYLAEKFPAIISSDNLFINAAWIADYQAWQSVARLKPGFALMQEGMILAARSDNPDHASWEKLKSEQLNGIELLDRPWKIFQWNGNQIRSDFDLLVNNRKSTAITDPHTRVYGTENIFIEDGAQIYASVINATTGPVYISKNAVVQEGCLIRGPFALGDSAQLSMGTKVRGNTTIGPHCKAGGELNTVVFLGFSNKVHDGYLGSSVIGSWCNLGAGTSASNLKNSFDQVRCWNYYSEKFEPTGLQFLGLMMGDFSTCAINTSFNTATVLGVGTRIFGAGFPRTFIPAFTAGGAGGYQTLNSDELISYANRANSMKGFDLSDADKSILNHVFEMTSAHRTWEKH